MGIIKIKKVYDHIEEIIIVIMFAVMVGAIFLQVVSRYVFNSSISWSESLGRYMFVWVSWLGVSLGQREGEHIKITLLLEKLPEKTAKLMNVLSDVVVIVIAGITIYNAIPIASLLVGNHVMEASLGVNQIFGFAAVPIGSGLMIIRCLGSIYNTFTGRLTSADGAKREGSEA